jgi:hypothetical protein
MLMMVEDRQQKMAGQQALKANLSAALPDRGMQKLGLPVDCR